MKVRTTIFVAVFCAAALIALGQGTQGTPLYVVQDLPYDVNSVPFPYDPNQVDGVLLGTVTQRAGKENGVSGTYYDPDGDPVNIRLSQCPATMLLKQDPTTKSYIITWNPTTAGTYYVWVTAKDTPPSGPSYETTGTILWHVLPQNTAPELKAIGNLYTH